MDNATATLTACRAALAAMEQAEADGFRKVYQTRNNGTDGNCFHACIASVLGLDLSDVPDILPNTPHEDWWKQWAVWFETQGIGWFFGFFDGLDKFSISIGALAILCGPSQRAKDEGAEYGHCIVARYQVRNGQHYFKYVHNPTPDAGPKETWLAGDPTDMLILWRNEPRNAAPGTLRGWRTLLDMCEAAMLAQRQLDNIASQREGLGRHWLLDETTRHDFALAILAALADAMGVTGGGK